MDEIQKRRLTNELLDLDEKRKKLELRATELNNYLTSPGMPGLKGGLNDSEGFPRADIDILGIVTARNELACINTDYNDIMKCIDTKITELRNTYI